MSTEKVPESDTATPWHEEDHYPTFAAVLDAIMDEEDLPEGPIERLEITCQASGDANWRVWTPRAEEHIGGYFPPGEVS